MKHELIAIFAIVFLNSAYVWTWIHLQGLRLHKRVRDSNGFLVPLFHSQERENKELTDAILFIIVHAGLLMSIYSLSLVGMIDWFSNWYGDSRIPAPQFWVPNLFLYPFLAFVKKLAYPETNPRPIFWGLFGVIGLIILITLVKSLEMGIWQVLLAAVILFAAAIVTGLAARGIKSAWS